MQINTVVSVLQRHSEWLQINTVAVGKLIQLLGGSEWLLTKAF